MKATTDRFMAMKGQGYYSKATTGAKDVIDGATPLVIAAIDRMKLADDGRVIRLSDMGSADGGTSIDLWRNVLKHIRSLTPSRPVELVYTDLPRNDFSQLFRIIHGQTDIRSYLDEIPNVFVFASANSFHRAIFPPGSLHLGFSSTASHYISKVPCDISDHVHMVGAKGGEREAFAAQGAQDWERMLLARAQELVTGGRLCLFNFGIDEEGRYLGNTGGPNMFDTFNEIWAEFAEEGRITRAEYRSTNFPQHYRTVEEFTAPFKDVNSSVFRAGLHLEHIETRVVRCPYARDFESHGDAQKFARDYIPTLRSWSEPVFLNGLSADRDPGGKAMIVDEFYGRYQSRVAARPHGHGMDYVHIYLVVRKDG
jgi:hypothetical protein